MNTFNLLNAIALLACISTPAYVIYYLKYFIREKIKTLQKDVSYLDSQVDRNQLIVEENALERTKELHDINELINQLESQLKSVNYKTSNTFENLHVDMNYLKRTLNDDMSKVNERIDLLKSTYKNELTKIRSEFNNVNSKIHQNERLLNAEVNRKIDGFNKQLDSLQSLNITTQNILKRINSKEFAREVLLTWMKQIKEESDAKEAKEAQEAKIKPQSKEKKKSTSTSNLTKPSESVQNEVVNIIKEDVNKKRRRGRPAKQTIPAPSIVEQEVVVVVQEKKIKKPKADAKRVISNRELEIFFKEQTQLTYRGFVIKYGEEAFKRAKQLIYKRLHYYKYQKSININKII